MLEVVDKTMPANLNGKVVVVTGATKGIGKGIALQLGAAGAKVYITGILKFLQWKKWQYKSIAMAIKNWSVVKNSKLNQRCS